MWLVSKLPSSRPATHSHAGAFVLCPHCTLNILLLLTEFSYLFSLGICLCPPLIFYVHGLDSVIFDFLQPHTVPVNGSHSLRVEYESMSHWLRTYMLLKFSNFFFFFFLHHLKPYSILLNLAFGLYIILCSGSYLSILGFLGYLKLYIWKDRNSCLLWYICWGRENRLLEIC